MRFIGCDLQDPVLSEYLKYSEWRKNATYLSVTSVAQFVKVISDWMRDETFEKLRSCENMILLLDESTNEANRSELSLITRIVNKGIITNHFLDLIQLRCGDADTIYTAVSDFLKKENIEITHTRFSGMDDCSNVR